MPAGVAALFEPRPWLNGLVAGAWAAAAFFAACLILNFGSGQQLSLLILAVTSAACYGATLDLHQRVAPTAALGERGARFIPDLIRVVIAFAGAWSIITLLNLPAHRANTFFNTPLVGYSAAIAILGAFFVSLLVRLARFWRAQLPGWLLVQTAFSWIGPFYGFFSAPVFLALGMSGLGPMRKASNLALIAGGMQVAEWCGWGLALWFTASVRNRDGRRG